MSRLREFRDTENELNQQLKKMEELKQNTALIKDLEFEKKLEALLKRYSKKMEDLLAFLKPLSSMPDTCAREKRPTYKTTPAKNSGNRKKARR